MRRRAKLWLGQAGPLAVAMTDDLRRLADPFAPESRLPMLRLARLAGFLGLVAIVILSWVPGTLRPSTGSPDWFEHATAYCLVSALLTATTRTRWPQLIALGLIVTAGILEIGQLWIPGRDCSWSDFLASSAGALIGAGLAALVLSRILGPDAKSDISRNPVR